MTTYYLYFGVILSLFKCSLQASTIDSTFYVGAAVEYHPVTTGDNGLIMAESNAKNYRTIIEIASQFEVDVIVFPEFGLTSLPENRKGDKRFNASEYRAYYENTASYIPDPNDSVIICDTNDKYQNYLRKISCAAREYMMYVVANVMERVDCQQPTCAPNNFLLYNTNVAFDRNGKVVAKYRKYYLYSEDGTNVTSQHEYSTFATDFGVTFGMVISLDIAHEQPTTYFLQNPNVTDVLYSTYWRDELPFNDAIQQEAAWSYGADVNLIASGLSDADSASGGSGIYAGRNGPIEIHQPRKTSNALVIAEIPKLNRQQPIEDMGSFNSMTRVLTKIEVPTLSGLPPPSAAFYPYFYKDDLRSYNTQVLDPKQGPFSTTLCNDGLCCDFDVETSYDQTAASTPNAKEYKYRLVAFNGVRNIANVRTAGLEVCALVACAGDHIEDCGSTYHSNSTLVLTTIFDTLKITRRGNVSSRAFYMPSTFTLDDYQPIETEHFSYIDKNSSQPVMNLLQPRGDVMTFGIYGRRYDRDGEKLSEPISAGSRFSSSIVIVAVATIFMTLRSHI